jgi:putative membrane protein
MMNGWDMTGWGWGWMTIWSLLLFLVIAVLIAAALRSSTGNPVSAPRDSALATLRRRYAAGEIDEAEFNQRRIALAEDGREEGIS